MNLLILKKHILGWILPFLILAGCGFAFVSWAESQMNVAGGVQDTEYWKRVLNEANVTGNLMPLSGYLNHRVAEMMVLPRRNAEAMVTYTFMDRVLRSSDPLRQTSDLKYSLAVYEKQLFLSLPSALRFYYSIRNYLIREKKDIGSENILILESDAQVEALRNMQKIEKSGNWQAVRAHYEKLLDQAEPASFQVPLMLKLAYFLYEKEPATAMVWIKKAIKKRPGAAMRQAAYYLKNKLSQKAFLEKKEERNSVELKLKRFLKMGFFEKAAELVAPREGMVLPIGTEEIQYWLNANLKEPSKEKQSVFSRYLFALGKCFEDPHAAADFFVRLAADGNAAALGALMRYQAWSLEYFDVKDYRRALVIAQMLKAVDPLSPYSQVAAMKGGFRPSQKFFTGAKLEELWREAPYRFEMTRKDHWSGFKGGWNRISEVSVHEGRVYVVNYSQDGKAKKLKEVATGEQDEIDTNENPQGAPKMGVIDRFFYDGMVEFVPRIIRSFKEQIWKRIENSKEAVFTRVYTEDEFQTYVLNGMRSVSGALIKNASGQIKEQGLTIYADLDFKMATMPIVVEGQLLVAGEDGRLMLKLKSAKAGKFGIPYSILRSVEKSFNRSANAGDASQVDILDIIYQSGSVLVKCRKKSEAGQ